MNYKVIVPPLFLKTNRKMDNKKLIEIATKESSLITIFQAVENTLSVLINSNNRNRDVVDARKIYSLLANEFTDTTFSKIGSQIKRDHSTITFNIRRGLELLRTDSSFNSKYLRCKNYLTELYELKDDGNSIDDKIKLKILCKELSEFLNNGNQVFSKINELVSNEI